MIYAYTKEAFPNDVELTKEQYKALAEADERGLNKEQETQYKTILEVGNQNIAKWQFCNYFCLPINCEKGIPIFYSIYFFIILSIFFLQL